MDFLLPLSEQYLNKSLVLLQYPPYSKGPARDRLLLKGHPYIGILQMGGEFQQIIFYFLSWSSTFQRRTFSIFYSASTGIKRTWADSSKCPNKLARPSMNHWSNFPVRVHWKQSIGTTTVYELDLILRWDERKPFSVEIMVSELLAWNLKGQDFNSEPCTSLERTEKFTLDFRNLPLRNTMGKYSYHMFQLEQSISFWAKRNWVKILCLAVLLGQMWSCFITLLKIFSNLNFISLQWQSWHRCSLWPPCFTHQKGFAHPAIPYMGHYNILFLNCWNRHLFWGTLGWFF